MDKPRQALHVAVGVIFNREGQILIARRHEASHQGGLWEFPGGKVEPDETVEQALMRELREELAITVEQANPLIALHHDYPDLSVFLDVWRVDAFGGNPRGMQNQPIRWATPDSLLEFDFPAANRPILAAARLPKYYPIVDGNLEDEKKLFRQLEMLCRHGYRLAQWRVRTDDNRAYLDMARRAVEYCASQGLALLLNAEPEVVLNTGAAGVHLTSRRLAALSSRPLPGDCWVAASCHDLEQIRKAEAIGADFAVLSPVLATASHPDSTPLGWEKFGASVDEAHLPVYALGGMDRSHFEEARRRGAQGIAGIRGFCVSEDFLDAP